MSKINKHFAMILLSWKDFVFLLSVSLPKKNPYCYTNLFYHVYQHITSRPSTFKKDNIITCSPFDSFLLCLLSSLVSHVVNLYRAHLFTLHFQPLLVHGPHPLLHLLLPFGFGYAYCLLASLRPLSSYILPLCLLLSSGLHPLHSHKVDCLITRSLV